MSLKPSSVMGITRTHQALAPRTRLFGMWIGLGPGTRQLPRRQGRRSDNGPSKKDDVG